MALSFPNTRRSKLINKERDNTTRYTKRLKLLNEKNKFKKQIVQEKVSNESCEDLLTLKLKENQKILAKLIEEDDDLELKIEKLNKKLAELDEDNLAINKNINKIELEYESRLETIENWYKFKRNEIQTQYEHECKQATQEFNEKRKELKDNLRNEYEDKKKLVEIERNLLDINVDSSEIKPQITRKLRRRGCAGTDTISNSNNQIIITSNSISTVTLCPNTNQISTFLNPQLNNVISSERKRRPSPANHISFALNDDEISDDLKYLNRNINTRHFSGNH